MICAFVLLFCPIFLSTSSSELSTSSLSQSELQPSDYDYDLSLDTKQKLPRHSSRTREHQEQEEIGEEREETKEGAYFREYVYRSPASVTTTKRPLSRHKFKGKGSEFHNDDYQEKRNGYSADSATDVRSRGDDSDIEDQGLNRQKEKKKRMYTSYKKSVFKVPIPPSIHTPGHDDEDDGYVQQDKRSSSSITSPDGVCPCLKKAKQNFNRESKKFRPQYSASHSPDYRKRPPSESYSSHRRQPVYYSMYEVSDDDEVSTPHRSQSSFHSDGQESNEEGANYSVGRDQLHRKRTNFQNSGQESEKKSNMKQLPRWKPSNYKAHVNDLSEFRPTKLNKSKVTSIQDILADVQRVL